MGLGKFGKLFFDEVEEENQTGSVSEKNTQSAAPTVSTQPVQQAPVQNIVDTQTQSVQQSTPVNNIFKNTETLNI